MFCFALSAVFIGFSPNVYKLTGKDILSRAIRNAELEAMQYGDIYLRAGFLDTNFSTSTPDNTTTASNFTYAINSTGSTINLVNITSNITVAENTGVEYITVSVEK